MSNVTNVPKSIREEAEEKVGAELRAEQVEHMAGLILKRDRARLVVANVEREIADFELKIEQSKGN